MNLAVDAAEARPYLLIDFEWLAELGAERAAELTRFARDAYAYDREAGFTDIVVNDPPAAQGGPNRHLVVYAANDDGESVAPEGRPAIAYLVVEQVDELGVGTARFVVAPEYRSRGVATLLVERLKAERQGADWYGTGLTGLRVLADGAHPAAERLSRRFGFPILGERWFLIRMLRGGKPVDGELAGRFESDHSAVPAEIRNGIARPVVGPGDGAPARTLVTRRYWTPGSDPEDGLVARHSVTADGAPDQLAHLVFGRDLDPLGDDVLQQILTVALDELTAAGAKAVMADVLPADGTVVRVCRKNYFQHDQSNWTFGVELVEH